MPHVGMATASMIRLIVPMLHERKPRERNQDEHYCRTRQFHNEVPFTRFRIERTDTIENVVTKIPIARLFTKCGISDV